MSSDNANKAIQSPLGTPNRYTTTHDPSTKKSIFHRSLPETLTPYGAVGMVVFDSYKTFTHPFTMSDENDVAKLQSHPPSAPNTVWFPAVGESLLRYCDWAPGETITFHRTETLDLGVCVAGSMELTLDSGETRVLKVGDTIVQRGTMHAWRNPSDTEWARVIFFLLGAEPVRVEGKPMEEDLPWSGEKQHGKQAKLD